jgi:hypothetical protein
VDIGSTLDQGLEELMDGDIIVFHQNYDVSSAVNGRKLKSLQEFYVYMQFKYVSKLLIFLYLHFYL